MLNNIDQITNLTDELSQGVKDLVGGNDKDRSRLMLVAHKLAQALEKPQETCWRLWMLDVRTTSEGTKFSEEAITTDNFFAQSITRAVVQVASDLKLPEHLPYEPDKAVGSARLAEETGAEQALLSE